MKFSIVLLALCFAQAHCQIIQVFPRIRCVQNNLNAVQTQAGVYPGAMQACLATLTADADIPTMSTNVQTLLTTLNTRLTTFAAIPVLQAIRRRQAALAAISAAAAVGPSVDQLVTRSNAVTTVTTFPGCVSTAVNGLRTAVTTLAAC